MVTSQSYRKRINLHFVVTKQSHCALGVCIKAQTYVHSMHISSKIKMKNVAISTEQSKWYDERRGGLSKNFLRIMLRQDTNQFGHRNEKEASSKRKDSIMASPSCGH